MLNGLAEKVRFFCGEVVTGLQGRSADVVLANILAHVLIQFARELTDAVSPGGKLVLSGILAVEEDKVRDAFGVVAPGWQHDSRVMGEWCDVLLTRPISPR